MTAKTFSMPVLFLLALAAAGADARESYKDVAVVINSNSTLSDSIGSYFAQQRLIPQQNIIRITTTTAEEITNAQFEDLRSQIEAYLTTHKLADSINYIVTTKGMPLKVNRGATSDYNSSSSSVESELCLILGPYASGIGQAGRVYSPYTTVQQSFSRREFGFYLVTRLDGYTYADIKTMIDNAARADSTVLETGRFVFDADPTRSMSPGTLNGYMVSSSASLRSNKRLTVMDTTTQYLTYLPSVLGYVSWGSNDANAYKYTDHAKPYHQFMRGSIAETYVSTSARSFQPGTGYGQSLIADLIAEGVTGVKGYVYEPYSSAIANVQYTFPMYAEGYNLAECFYAASAYLSWMDVVIGDPKMRIRTIRIPQSMEIPDGDAPGPALPVELAGFSAVRTAGGVRLEWTTATEVGNHGFGIEKYSAGAWTSIGFVAGSGTSNAAHRYLFTDRDLSQGTHSYRLKQIDNDGKSSYSKTVEVCIEASAKEFRLNANYPNPFNPSTSLSFTVAQSGRATLKVYNAIGQEIAVLYNGMAESGAPMTVTFDGSSLSSGIYFSVLESAGSRMVQKMVLSK